MNACREYEDLLGAHRDKELDAAASTRVTAHVASCPHCRAALDELDRTADLVHAHFETVIAAAPPPPRSLQLLAEPESPVAAARRRTMNRLKKTLAGLAAAALILAGLTLFPGKQLDAGPRALLASASARYLDLHDVELLVTPECRIFGEPLDLTVKLDGEEGTGKLISPFKVIFDAPHRFLFHSDPRPDSFRAEGFVFGFDGKEAWSYDHGKKTVRRCPVLRMGEVMKFRFEQGDAMHTTITLENPDFFANLSWNYMRGLNERSGDLDITEVTTRLDERAGRRVFDLAVRETDGGDDEDSPLFWKRSRVTICPKEDLIVKYEFDCSFAIFVSFHLTMEVTRINRGFEPGFFGHERFVPAGTTSVFIEAEPEDGGGDEPAGERMEAIGYGKGK